MVERTVVEKQGDVLRTTYYVLRFTLIACVDCGEKYCTGKHLEYAETLPQRAQRSRKERDGLSKELACCTLSYNLLSNKIVANFATSLRPLR
jgi:hypothetical protein